MGAEIIAWLLQPWILVPLTTVATLFLSWDVAYALAKRRAVRQAAHIPFANIDLRDVFTYLRFGSRWAMQFSSSDDCAIAAGQEIEDQMRMGRLPIWGRDKSFTFSTSEKIDPAFWTGMTLSRGSLWSTAQDLSSAESRPANYLGRAGLWWFHQLRSDALEMRKIWPPAPAVIRPVLRWRMANIGVDLLANQRHERRALRHKRWRKWLRAIPDGMRVLMGRVRMIIFQRGSDESQRSP